MTRTVGPILRVVGPILQVACLIALMRPGSRGWRVAGQRIEPLLYGGMLLGLILVLAGIALSAAPTARRPSSRDHETDTPDLLGPRADRL